MDALRVALHWNTATVPSNLTLHDNPADFYLSSAQRPEDCECLRSARPELGPDY